MATPSRRSRYIETLPGGVSHEIFKLYDNGRLDNTPEVTVPARPPVRDGRQTATIPPTAAFPSAKAAVGLLPVDDLVGRADAVV